MFRSGLLWGLALSLLGLLCARTTLAQSSPDSTIRRDTVALDRDGEVEISDTHSGRITVTTWDRAMVAYEAILAPEDTTEAPPVSNLQIDHSDQRFALDHDGSSWSISIPGLLRISTSGERNLRGHYHITMPEAAALEIDDYSSTIEISGLKADVEVETHAGKTVIDSVQSTPVLDTHAGSVKATALRGGVVLDTHGGEASIAFDEFSASSEVETLNGTVRLFLPPDAGFELRLDLDDEHLTVDEAFGTPTSSDDERRIYNGGGPPLKLDSSSGTVEVRPLEAGPSP